MKVTFKTGLLAIFISISGYSQSSLIVDNPGPRVGDNIKLSIRLEAGEESIGRGDIELYEQAENVGSVTFGPFTFTVAGKVYETGTVTVNVSPKLPANVLDGIWVRLIPFQEEYFLIIEQRISNQWKRERKSSTELQMTHGDGVVYADFMKEKLEESGIDVTSFSTSTGSQIVDEADALGKGTVSFKEHVIRFHKTGQFSKKIKIDKSFFTNFPAKGKFEEAWIE